MWSPLPAAFAILILLHICNSLAVVTAQGDAECRTGSVGSFWCDNTGKSSKLLSAVEKTNNILPPTAGPSREEGSPWAKNVSREGAVNRLLRCKNFLC